MTADLALTVLFVLLTVALSQQVETKLQQPHNFTCQFWTHYNQQTGCECANGVYHVVSCKRIDGSPTKFSVSVLYGYCMTLNKKHTKAVVGACPFNQRHNSSEPKDYKPLPSNLSDVDNAVCGFTYILSTPTIHSVSAAPQELTTGPSTWLYLCYPQLSSSWEL